MSEILHGTPTAYIGGCRCLLCKAGWARAQAERVESRRRRLAEDFYVVTHGLNSTYVNWGCRCSPCSEAHAIACRRARPGKVAA